MIIYQSNSTHFLNLFGLVQSFRIRLLDQDATNNLIHGKTKSGWISGSHPLFDTEIEIRPLHLHLQQNTFGEHTPTSNISNLRLKLIICYPETYSLQHNRSGTSSVAGEALQKCTGFMAALAGSDLSNPKTGNLAIPDGFVSFNATQEQRQDV